MSGLERRLKKLAEEAGAGVPCEECGHPIGGPPATARLDFVVSWYDHGSEDLGDEFCSACGRQLVIHMDWGVGEQEKERAIERARQIYGSGAANERKLRLVEDDA
jgi:hypothetical protein